ncbi:PREDICTED: uncharacterized protein LOC108557559 [Nicrophorus vespilloides]|uniref:Uncharacterized protein LOC108557559 n=1 Tax=Nicrophorus vespilloides TaxID=110193 RepID=A0ABM1M4V8_NICVS|nr:PREDICTED: uncharacterized protein LOC108557559 [Nicrophorus vespilloides]
MPGGVELKLIQGVAEQLKIQFEVLPNDYPDPGFEKLKNGSYKYMFADLYNKKVDCFLGFIGMYQEDCVTFDCSFPHYFSHMSFFVPLAEPLKIWMNMFLIFQLPLWIFLLVIFILISTLWMYLQKKQTFVSSCFYLFGLVFSSAPKQPTETKLRMAFLAWILFSFLIANGFLSVMVSFLSKHSYEFQISNVHEMLQSNLHFGGFSYLKTYFDGNDTEHNIKLFREFVDCDDKEICLDKVVKFRNFALVDDTRIILYNMKNKGYKAFMLPNIITAFPSIYLDKGSPYLDRINEAIVALYENGLNSKWDPLLKVHHEAVLEGVIALRLEHLQCSIYGYILGIFISVMCFIWELCVDNNKSKIFVYQD